MSQLKDMDVQIPAKATYYRLLSSPSVEQSLADTDLESLPLLSVASGDSSTSLSYINILPFKSASSLGGIEQERTGSKTYFEMKLDRSAGIVYIKMITSSSVQSKVLLRIHFIAFSEVYFIQHVNFAQLTYKYYTACQIQWQVAVKSTVDFFPNLTSALLLDVNTAHLSVPAIHTPRDAQVSSDPSWLLPGVQCCTPTSGLQCGEGFLNSSSHCNISNQGPGVTPLQEHIFNRKHREHIGEVRGTHESSAVNNNSTRALQYLINCPTELMFSQERYSLHASEVSVLRCVKDCPEQHTAIQLDWMSSKHSLL